jgi:ribosomal protein S18 acetylase RimI-like enzyme
MSRQDGVWAAMNVSIQLRDATVDDAPRVSGLLTALAEEFIVGDFTTAGRSHLLAHFVVSEMASRLNSGEYRFHVAEDRAELVGVVAVRGATHLQYLFVAGSHQRSGLARRLWTLARLEAMSGGNAAGRFTVNASAYAVRAYERLGFRCVGPVKEANGVRFQPMESVRREAGED